MARSLILRLDVTPAIGLGHLRRAITLAVQAQALGLQARFACDPESWPILVAQGVSADALVEPGQIVSSAGPQSAVIVDTLWAGNAGAVASEVEALVAAGLAVAVIDSLPPDHYETVAGGRGPHLVITPYLGADRLRKAPKAGRWLVGPPYAVLDPAFGTARLRVQHNVMARILFACGGSDPEGTTAAFAERLSGEGLPIDLVIGPLFAESLCRRVKAAAALRPRIILHHSPLNLARLVEQAGIVTGRVGLVRYEAAALGRNGLYIHFGKDFREYLEGFAAAGLAKVHFATDPGGFDAFLDRLTEIAAWDGLGSPPPEFTFNSRAYEIVDLNGARRIIDVLQEIMNAI